MPIEASSLAMEGGTYLRMLVLGGPKVGKAQPLDEPVLTPMGWRTMGELRVGDEVIGSSRNPIRVVGVYPQGKRPVYEVRTTQGFARCCGEHLWCTTTAIDTAPQVRTTEEIRATLGAMHRLPAYDGVGPVVMEVISTSVVAECVCITVDAADSLYATRGHLLTHNSTTVISTCPLPAYVINCDQKEGLVGASRRTKKFKFDMVKDWNTMTVALKEAREGVKAGTYKTIVFDTVSSFASMLEEQCLAETANDKGIPDGRRAYPEYNRRLQHVIMALFNLKAHVIATSHYIEVGGEIDGNLAKTGEGLVPLLAGKARALIPMLFNDIVFLDIKKGERFFTTSPRGVFGPGGRSLEGIDVCLPSIEEFLKLAGKQAKVDAGVKR